MAKYDKILVIPLLALILMPALTNFLTTNVYAETIPVGDMPYPYDMYLYEYHYTSGEPREPENLPSGQWYTNIDFDSDPSNYAWVGFEDTYGRLHSYSYATFYPDCHGWSNAFFHQGRPPYAGGVYEGKFRAWNNGNPIEVDGIKYQLWVDNDPTKGMYYEPEGKYYLKIKLIIDERYVRNYFAFCSVLFFALFQYEWMDGSLSLYDAPAKTNHVQALHYDIFLSRARRTFGWYSEDEPGTEGWDWGDAYNDDLHVQYVVAKLDRYTWYTITLDWGKLINVCKALYITACINEGKSDIAHNTKSLILRYIGVSAEVIGSEIWVRVDFVKFYEASS